MEDQQQMREIALTIPIENHNNESSLPTNQTTNESSPATNNGNNGENNESSLSTNNGEDYFDENVKDDNDDDDDDDYFSSFPPGYRFKPADDELVVHYLSRKVFDQKLPPNRIRDVELYEFDPATLAENYHSYEENEWYFFTPRKRKYRHGERPNRAAGDGFWKATGADRAINSNGVKVGCRKALVFYKGKAPNGDKTDWIMHEYRVLNAPIQDRNEDDMRLDAWVLCRVYKKADKSNKAAAARQEDDCDVNHTEEPENETRRSQRRRNNRSMPVDNAAMVVTREAFMPMKTDYGHGNFRMEQLNVYGHGPSYATSLPRMPHIYDPSLDQTSSYYQHMLPGYEKPLSVMEPFSSSKFPFRSMENPMKQGRFNDYQHDNELFALPSLENYDANLDNFDQLFGNMDNNLPGP